MFQKRLVSWAKRRGTVYKSSEESCLVSLFFGKTFYKKGGRTIGSWLFFFFFCFWAPSSLLFLLEYVGFFIRIIWFFSYGVSANGWVVDKKSSLLVCRYLFTHRFLNPELIWLFWGCCCLHAESYMNTYVPTQVGDVVVTTTALDRGKGPCETTYHQHIILTSTIK